MSHDRTLAQHHAFNATMPVRTPVAASHTRNPTRGYQLQFPMEPHTG